MKNQGILGDLFSFFHEKTGLSDTLKKILVFFQEKSRVPLTLTEIQENSSVIEKVGKKNTLDPCRKESF